MKKSLKLLQLILALVMVVCIIPFNASAEAIPNITLRYHFNEGQIINYNPADTSQYSVKEIEWADADNGQPLSDQHVAKFEENYQLTVTLMAKGSYLFSSDDTEILFNGVRIYFNKFKRK